MILPMHLANRVMEKPGKKNTVHLSSNPRRLEL